ncbi:MAG TPA: V-type ATPase subunit [Candidatus Hydrogenedentes bacterium]|nr:V-type ATPase subunit [Candidatus Hydrogenedentota bacterium]HPG66415.1 V-type ATPase subunit [Candidatus Hydrogenedentota bacterium]
MAGPEVEFFAMHFNARVRAMRGVLFPRERMDDLLESQDLSIIIEMLLNSPYAVEMAEALARYQGADAVEDAATRNMVSCFRKLTFRASGRYRELASRFLLRWDLAAVKSLLRFRHHEGRREEARAVLVPGPTLSAALVNDLVGRSSMTELVSGLVLWNAALCGCLRSPLRQYEQEQDLALLEEALDRRYFVDTARELWGASDENGRILRRVVEMEIDRINLRMLFQFIDARTPANLIVGRMLPGGALSPTALAGMAGASGVVELMELLERTMYRDLVELLFQFLQTRRFSPIERNFELTLMREVRRLARRHPFSIAVLMDYAWRKYNEITNIRLIARGEARHLPRGRVREELLYA